MRKLFVFGLGYTGFAIAQACAQKGWHVMGTRRNPADLHAIDCIVYDSTKAITIPSDTTHLLSTIAPNEDSTDAIIDQHQSQIESLKHLQWTGYLSATSVYGDAKGAWVDESIACHPSNARGNRRYQAEQLWQALNVKHAAHIFRLAGIYGPGRSLLDRLVAGKARRIIKPGQVFSRIHLDDIVAIVLASMNHPTPGEIYNCADDHPCNSTEIIEYLCAKHDLALPPEVLFDDPSLSEMVRSFYQDCRRIDNQKIKQQLNIRLKYPSYRNFY